MIRASPFIHEIMKQFKKRRNKCIKMKVCQYDLPPSSFSSTKKKTKQMHIWILKIHKLICRTEARQLSYWRMQTISTKHSQRLRCISLKRYAFAAIYIYRLLKPPIHHKLMTLDSVWRFRDKHQGNKTLIGVNHVTKENVCRHYSMVQMSLLIVKLITDGFQSRINHPLGDTLIVKSCFIFRPSQGDYQWQETT